MANSNEQPEAVSAELRAWVARSLAAGESQRVVTAVIRRAQTQGRLHEVDWTLEPLPREQLAAELKAHTVVRERPTFAGGVLHRGRPSTTAHEPARRARPASASAPSHSAAAPSHSAAAPSHSAAARELRAASRASAHLDQLVGPRSDFSRQLDVPTAAWGAGMPRAKRNLLKPKKAVLPRRASPPPPPRGAGEAGSLPGWTAPQVGRDAAARQAAAQAALDRELDRVDQGYAVTDDATGAAEPPSPSLLERVVALELRAAQAEERASAAEAALGRAERRAAEAEAEAGRLRGRDMASSPVEVASPVVPGSGHSPSPGIKVYFPATASPFPRAGVGLPPAKARSPARAAASREVGEPALDFLQGLLSASQIGEISGIVAQQPRSAAGAGSEPTLRQSTLLSWPGAAAPAIDPSLVDYPAGRELLRAAAELRAIQP